MDRTERAGEGAAGRRGNRPSHAGAGGRLAERVIVNVGALADRVAWATDVARQGRAGSITSAEPLSLGAYLVVAAHPDVRVARDLARGPLAPYAHFSGMPGGPSAGLTAEDRAVVEALTADYAVSGHSTRHPSEAVRLGRSQPHHLVHLDDRFVDRFAVVGPPQHCVARLRELEDLGLGQVLLVEGRHPSLVDEGRRAHRCLVEEVLPALRHE